MAHMDINRALANMDDDDEIPQSPSATGFVAMDKFFEAADFAIPEVPADELIMKLPQGRFAKTTRARLKSCTTSEQLRELDRSLYREAGLDPARYGL